MKLGGLAGIVAAVALMVAPAPVGAVTITEFPGNPKTIFSFPVNITSGPEGNLWWTDIEAEPGIVRMTPSGEYLPRIADSNHPVDVVVAPDGRASWVSEKGFGTRSPDGIVSKTESALHGRAIILAPGNRLRWGGREGVSVTVLCQPDPDGEVFLPERTCFGWKDGNPVTGLAAAADGTLWASVSDSGLVRIFNAAFVETKTVELPVQSGPLGIAVGPEGSAWVAMSEASSIDRITADGARTRFPLPPGSEPLDIVLGPDGAFWITESGSGKIGRMTPAGVLTNEYPVPSGETNQIGITVGPDGNIWYTDPEAGKVGRLIPDPLLGPPAPTGDTVGPSFIGKPKFSPARFAAAGKKARASRKGGSPTGTKLKFTLSEAAKVTVAIARKAAGRKAGRKCVAPAKAKPGAAKCSRYITVGGLAPGGVQGANAVPFDGKLKGRALAPGGYRATLVARDAAGNASAPALASFTIVG